VNSKLEIRDGNVIWCTSHNANKVQQWYSVLREARTLFHLF